MIENIVVLFVVAIMAVTALVIMFARINLRRFLGYPNCVDVFATLIFVMLFHGTFSGMVVAGFASLTLSMLLWAMRSGIGCERLAWGGIRRGWYWKYIPASECQPHWIAKVFSR